MPMLVTLTARLHSDGCIINSVPLLYYRLLELCILSSVDL